MRSKRRWVSSVGVLAAVACGSSPSEGVGAGPGDGGSGTFEIDAGSYGSFSCAMGATAESLQGLTISCSEPGDGALGMSLLVTNWHGTGSYTTTDALTDGGCISGLFLELQLPDTELLENGAGAPGEPVAKCTAMMTGPASLTQGSEVTASVRCTNMTVGTVCVDGGCTTNPYVTVTAKIDVFVAY
jgi:hypothetical protein